MKQNFDQIVEENSRLRLENEKTLSKLETMSEMEVKNEKNNDFFSISLCLEMFRLSGRSMHKILVCRR